MTDGRDGCIPHEARNKFRTERTCKHKTRRQAAPVRESCRQEYCRIIKVLLSLLHTDPAPQGRGSIFFNEIASAQNGMGQSNAKSPETRFGRPWQAMSRKTAPHAIPHDGAPVTHDMASPTRRRQKYIATGNTACDLRRGIIADAEIRRRLSGEKYIRQQIGCMLSHFPRGVREASPRTRRVSKPAKAPDTPFTGIVSRRGSMMHDNAVGNCRNTRGTPRFGFRKFPPPASLRPDGKLERGRLHAMSHKSSRRARRYTNHFLLLTPSEITCSHRSRDE